jgi:hypothetical protein
VSVSIGSPLSSCFYKAYETTLSVEEIVCFATTTRFENTWLFYDVGDKKLIICEIFTGTTLIVFSLPVSGES